MGQLHAPARLITTGLRPPPCPVREHTVPKPMTDSLSKFAVIAITALFGTFICGSFVGLLNEILGFGLSETGCMMFGAAIFAPIYKDMPL